MVFGNTTGFLRTANLSLSSGGGQSDHLFASRQQLIAFMGSLSSGTDTQNALQYFTTFSRDLSQPSLIRYQSTNASKNKLGSYNSLDYNANVPKILDKTSGGNSEVGNDDKVNPSFLGVRWPQDKTFTDDADTQISVRAGDLVVPKRFVLNRLAWLTYRGPSANRNTAAVTTTGTDGDIGLLKQYGITQEWLNLGTEKNIKKYFGLTWDGSKWSYNVHNGNGSGIGQVMDLADVASLGGPHEPDFFELLKASINVGSLGKALLPDNTSAGAQGGAPASEQPYNYNYYVENSVDFQVLQIGANIISQYQTSNYPPTIYFNDGKGLVWSRHTVVGVTNLPYLQTLLSGVLQVKAPNPKPPNNYPGSTYASGTTVSEPGVGALMLLPVIWNPHDPTSSVGANGPTRFRVVADSISPDQLSTSSRNSYAVYAKDVSHYSYDASNLSPGSSWYVDSTGTGAKISHQFTADNTAIELTLAARSTTTKPLFPEPTMLVRAQTITDMNGNSIQVALGSGHLINTDGAVSSLRVNPGSPTCGLPNYFANALNMLQPSQPQDGVNTSYIGFYLGAFPLAWNYAANPANPAATQTAASASSTGCFWGGSQHSGTRDGILFHDLSNGVFGCVEQLGSLRHEVWTGHV
ncbi:MAG: hypothetical protein QM796_08665 [Chthoniobacteraceae bacterium]